MADLNGAMAGFGEGDSIGASGLRMAGAVRSAERGGALLGGRFASAGPTAPPQPARPIALEVTNRLSARLIRKDTKCGLPGVRVEAWDASGACTDLVAVATTSGDGSFTMALTAAETRVLFGERRPALSFKFFTTTHSLPNPTWTWILGPSTTQARFEVSAEEVGDAAPTPSVVRGRLRTWTGRPIVGASVRALDVGVSMSYLLGSSNTDERGCYSISYFAATTGSPDAAPNLQVRASEPGIGPSAGDGQRERRLTESPIYCHAPPTLEVNLSVGGAYVGPSRYEQVLEKLGPDPDYDVTELTPWQLDRLACRLGADRLELEMLASARRAAASMSLPEEALFGVMKSGLPMTSEALVREHPREVRAAFMRAVESNDISPALRSRVELVLERFRAAVTNRVLGFEGGAPTPMGEVLTAAFGRDATKLLEFYLRSEAPDPTSFWASLRHRSVFAAGNTLQKTQFMLGIADLSVPSTAPSVDLCIPSPQSPRVPADPNINLWGDIHVPLLTELTLRRDMGLLRDASDLAKYTLGDWITLVNEVGVPSGVPGLSASARTQNYALQLKGTIAQTFSTKAIAASVAAGWAALGASNPGALASFFDSPTNAKFEFGKTRVAPYLSQTTGALSSVPEGDRAAVADHLKKIERLYKLTSDGDEILALLQHGIGSAAVARELGVDFLVREVGLSSTAARRIVGNACVVSGNALAIHTIYGSSYNVSLYGPGGSGSLSSFLPNKTRLKADVKAPLSDWKKLFGEADVCDCRHCHSVYGPAAYLVDVLRFLDGIDVGKTRSARDVLLERGSSHHSPRRPDIAKIDLSCPNTDTPLPYVDLVNEILEHVASALFGSGQLLYPDHIATTGTARDLLAAPETLQQAPHDEAYAGLASQPHPWSLPFHLWLAEARAFLPQLGAPLHGIMQALSPEGPPSAPSNDKSHLPPPYAFDTTTAWERLGLWKSARDILLDQPGVSPPLNWGFKTSQSQWAAELLKPLTFLDKSGLSYDELLMLLGSGFIRHFVAANAPNPYLYQAGPLQTCDLEKMAIAGLQGAPKDTWNVLHRFLRLQRRLGYSIDELDAVVASLTPSGAPVSSLIRDDEFLKKLAIVEHFHADRGVDLHVVSSWFGAIDTRRRGRPKAPSFFERVFQSRAVSLPVDSTFDLEDADGPATPTELANTTHLFRDHATALRGALGLSAKDFTLLTDDGTSMVQVGTGAELPAASTLTLASLSKAHRLVTLARALALPMTDFLALKRLFGDVNAPAGAALFTPENTFLFAQVVDRVRRGTLTPADLLFVFYGHTTSASKLVAKEARFSTLVQRLEAGLIAVRQAMPAVSIVDGALLLPVLRLLWSNESMVSQAHRILLGEAPEQGDEAWFTTHLLPFFAHSDASTRFFGEAKLGAGSERTSYAYGQLKAFADSDKLIIQTFAADLGVPPDVTAVLLAIVDDGASTPSTLVELCRLGAFDSTIDPPLNPPRLTFIDYTRLHRATAPVRTLGMSTGELLRLCVYEQGLPPSERLFDVNALVHAAAPVAPEEWFRRWLLLTELWKLRDELIGGPEALLSLLPSGPTDNGYELVARVVATTGWAQADVAALTARLLSATPTPQDLPALVLGLTRLRHAILTLRPFRTDALTVIERWVTLGTASPEDLKTNGASASIVRAVRARYGEDEWPDVARPLRDKVREGQRAALVDYLTTSGYAQSADELYAWLLVDVEMDACMLTSRIKQAIGSVQTFVQRALMNLEPDVRLNADQAREWAWMKHYRVWEANRKIFLYPENWIEPALRDDKTPFFTQLESDLRRGDITDDNVEQAYVRYLEKLVDVASLEIVTIYTEESTGAVHLIGRTFSEPHRYFYCVGRATSSSMYSRVWTPWEPLELDISSDHILLTVYNHRLHLLWAVIEEKPNSTQKTAKLGSNGDPASSGDEAHTHLEIRLAWSERKRDRWDAPRTSRSSLSTEFHYTNNVTIPPLSGGIADYNLTPEDLTFGVVLAGDQLRIACMMRLARLFRITQNYQTKGFLGFSQTIGHFYIEPCRMDVVAEPAAICPVVASQAVGSQNQSQSIEEIEKAKNYWQQKVNYILKTSIFGYEFLSSEDQEIVDKYRHNIDDLDSLLEHINSSPLPVDIETSPGGIEVKLSALRPNDWDWNWSGQRLRPRTHNEFVVNDGNFIIPILSYDAVQSLKSTVIRSIRMEFVDESEVDWPKPYRMPLVLSSSEGLLQGTSYLFARYFFVLGKKGQCRATNLFHPHACRFLTGVRASGVDALFSDRKLQMDGFDPIGTNNLAGTSLHDWQTDAVDFDYGGLYSTYNWELFFHAPLLIATRLSANRRYEEAQKWFHRIFDPTLGAGEKGAPWEKPPYSFWRFRPFFENKDLTTIQDELLNLSLDAATKGSKTLKALDKVQVDSAALAELSAQIEAWRADPFKPHVIARLRPLAYQKAVLIKYIENLIAWGDDLFRRDTIESITEATQLYILGRGLLGPRPRKISPPTQPPAKTAGELKALDGFGDALVETESLVPPRTGCGACAGEPLPRLFAQYFCVPGNDKLTELWDTIADRLFKLRHCMNIDGVVRELALFEPPIDPALLVRATAAGVDINSVLNDLNAGTLPYRFQVVHGRAMDLAAGVASLGQSLLQVLEKGDAEALARMRSVQEIEVLQSGRRSRALEVKEAEQALAAAQAAQAVIEKRLSHYEALIAAGWSAGETGSLVLNIVSAALTVAGSALSSAASGVAAIPDMSAGVNFGPQTLNKMTGGEKIALGLRMGADALAMSATAARGGAEALATTASYERRSEEWAFQVQLAKAELRQSAKQIATAQIRVAVASAALDTHDLQTENAKAVDEFMRRKLTNEDLYQWMSDRIMDIYYEAYKLAYDMAKRAEKAFQTELAIDGAPKYISFGYWDSAKRGLTAGEQLLHALRGLDVAYHEQNKRELEITKHVSLATFFPVELLQLRESGKCDVDIPESLFNYDFSSHYLRRLRHVSLTVDGVSGPYTGVNSTLRLKSSTVRRKPSTSAEPVVATVPIQAVATSSGQMDSGLFEPNLRDERYLPFEGAGAVSAWNLSIQREANAFDLRTVSDVVLHLQYTARDGGTKFATDVEAAGGYKTRVQKRLISLRADYAMVWEVFVSQGTADVPLLYRDFRYLVGDKGITISTIKIYIRGESTMPDPVVKKVVGEGAETVTVTWSKDNATNLRHGIGTDPGIEIIPKPESTDVSALRLSMNSIVDVDDVYIVLTYTQSISLGE